jgi:hypothetical protein
MIQIEDMSREGCGDTIRKIIKFFKQEGSHQRLVLWNLIE